VTIQFSLFGFPVRVQPWFLVTAWFIGPRTEAPVAENLIWVAVVFVGVLLHELGHASAGRALGLAPSIELHAFGGLTGWRSGRSLSPLQSVAVSAAGPAAGIAIGLTCLAVSRLVQPVPGSLGAYLVLILVWVNLGWAVFNLLPVLPLDGGNIATALAELILGPIGRRVARIVSLVATVTLALWALFSGRLWLAIIGGLLTALNGQALRAELRRGAVSARRAPRLPALQPLAAALEARDWVTLAVRAEEVAAAADDPRVREQARQYLAWGLLGQSDPAGARQTLAGVATVDPGLLGSLLLAERRAEEALPLLRQSLATASDPLVEARWRQAVSATRSFHEAAQFLHTPKGKGVSPDAIQALEQEAHEAGDHAAAADLGAALFARRRDPTVAYNVACSLSRSGRTEEALGWLELAVREGFADIRLLDEDRDLEPLRACARFQELRRRAR